MTLKRLVILFILFSFSLLGAEKDWILLEKGKKLFREGDFGKAMTFFKQAQTEYPGLPEAEWWIGRIFMIEGDYKLAEAQLLKAYTNRKNLYILEEQYEIMYQLSEIYFYNKKDANYTGILLEILNDHDLYILPTLEYQRIAMETMLGSSGLERLLTLYRDENNFAALAHLRLGVFFTQSARYSKGLTHLMFYNLSLLSKAISFRLEMDPDFEFTTMDELLSPPYGAEITGYLSKHLWSESLYYLSLALIGSGKKTGAIKVLEILIKYADSPVWKKKAQDLYNSPKLIPILEKTMPQYAK